MTEPYFVRKRKPRPTAEAKLTLIMKKFAYDYWDSMEEFGSMPSLRFRWIRGGYGFNSFVANLLAHTGNWVAWLKTDDYKEWSQERQQLMARWQGLASEVLQAHEGEFIITFERPSYHDRAQLEEELKQHGIQKK